jgi:hypothetical protein
MAEVTITGDPADTPRKRVQVLAVMAAELSRLNGEDDLEAAFALLTASVHLLMKFGGRDKASEAIAAVLPDALEAAAGFFPRETVQ